MKIKTSAAAETQTISSTGLSTSHVRVNEILVPIDLSKVSLKALQYGVSLAAQYGARLTLLHVIEPIAVATDLGPAPFADREEIAGMEQQLSRIRENRIPQSISTDTAVRCDIAADGILAATAELEPDLVILATHGRTGLKRFVLGSTAEKVVRTASCPVLVVRESERDFV